MTRTLRSKRLRALLWYAADGKCQICGEPLGDAWEADHIVPWMVSQETDIDGMQALCKTCNRKKGTRCPMRKHQIEFERLMERIVARRTAPRWIIAHVAPGGGKSALPVIALHYLRKAGIAQKICWITPNINLRDQAEDSFNEKWLKDHLRHDIKIVKTGNVGNLSKGTDGYATTISAIRAAYKTAQETGRENIHISEFKSTPYAVFIDELHHQAVKGESYQALEPILNHARIIIAGTGTLDRSDGQSLPIPYLNGLPDKASTDNLWWINYGIRDATNDEAIIKTEFRFVDGATRYFDHETNSERETEELGDDRNALMTALQTGYAIDLLNKCIDDWLTNREHHNPRSKMLVVCSNTAQARRMLQHITRQRGIRDAEIATIHEGEVGDASILRFRKEQRPRILVTVYKAYEGLDVPAVTHIACLTHIRSKPWITQMIARAWRFDRGDEECKLAWDRQRAVVFCPNDLPIREVIEEIEAEQDRALRDLMGKRTGGNGNGHDIIMPPTVTPLSSTATFEIASELGGNFQSPAMTAFVQNLRETNEQLAGFGNFEVEAMIRAFQQQGIIPQNWTPPEPRPRRAPELNESTLIEQFRSKLTFVIRKAARHDVNAIKRIENTVKRTYGERSAMDKEACLNAISDICRWFGVSDDGENN